MPGHGRPAAQGRDSHHPPDLVAFEGVTRRAGEVHVGGLDAVGVGVGGHQPEHGVSARERPIDDVGVAVRPLDDLNAIAGLRRKAGGVTHDDADRLAAAGQVLEDLVADEAGGCGDDDHRSSFLKPCIATIHIDVD